MSRKKSFRKGGLLIIGVLLSQLSYTQINFLPGYVININGDTLHGFVDYGNWGINPGKIHFKTESDNNSIIYTPIDIKEFKVADEIYESGIVNTLISPTNTNHLEYNPQINIKIDTAFLQTLFRGKKCLYFYRNSDGRENFYIKQDTGFDLLLYKRYLKQQDGKYLIVENKTFLGQLTLYFNDCESINSKLESTSYNQKSLLRLFEYYYKCSPSNIYFQKEIENIHAELGILAGISSTSLGFTSDAFIYLVDAGYNSSVNLSTGLFFDFILPRNSGKWSINNEILFSTYNVSGSYEDFKNENHYTITTTEIGYSYLKFNNLIRFNYPIGNLFIFFNGGISNGISLRETNYKKEEIKFYTTERIVEKPALNDTRKYEQCFVLGTGVRYNRFSIETRYEKGNGMSEYIALKSTTIRYYFLLGYKF